MLNNNNMDEDDHFDEEEEGAYINNEDIEEEIELNENDAQPEDLEEDEEWTTDLEENENTEIEIPDESFTSFNLHTDAIYSINIYEDTNNKTIKGITSSADDTSYFIEFNNNLITPIKQLKLHKDTVLDSKFNFDKTLIATSSMDGTIGIWNGLNGELINTLEGNNGESFEWIDWHPKGNVIIGGSSDATCWMFNVNKNVCLNVFAGHSQTLTCGNFINDGKLIVTGSEDASIKIWNPKTSECLITYSNNEKNIKSFCQDAITCLKHKDQLILCGSVDGSIALCHTEQQRVISHLYHKQLHTDSIEDVLFHPQLQNILLSASMDGQIGIWDTKANLSKQVLKNTNHLNTDNNTKLIGVTKMLFDDANPYLLYTCDINGGVKRWDIRTNQIEKVYQGHREVVTDICQTADYLFTTSEDKRLLVFKK